mgnify:CR=1 FL=1
MARLLEDILTRGSAPEQILTDIYRTVSESVRTKLIGTNLVAMRLGPGDIPGTTLDIVHQTRNSLAVHLVVEGAEIPISTEDTYRYQVRPRKWATRPLVTREMVEDSLFAVMERQLKEAGYQMARNLDRNILLLALRQGSGNTVTGLAAITVANIATAIQNLETNDYVFTDMGVGAAVANDLRNIDTFVEANKAGVNDPSKSLIGTIFGGKVHQTNNLTSNEGGATNATDAVCLDRDWAMVFAEKRPLTVDRYNDVTRQLEGIVLSARWDARTIPDTEQATAPYTSTAISLITTT